MTEPKFKVGDTIRHRSGHIFTITDINPDNKYSYYQLKEHGNDYFHKDSVEDNCRKLTKLERALK